MSSWYVWVGRPKKRRGWFGRLLAGRSRGPTPRADRHHRSPRFAPSFHTTMAAGPTPRLASPVSPRRLSPRSEGPVRNGAPTPIARRSPLRTGCVTLLVLLAGLSVAWLLVEVRTSRTQAHLFSRLAADLTYRTRPGPSTRIRFPTHGPYDVRLGYTSIPAWQARLQASGYSVTSQADWSPRLIRFVERGFFPPYGEKTQAGLVILDCLGRPLVRHAVPQRVYERYEDIPPILVRMLLYIEDRNLLTASSPCYNPAIDWRRQGKAVLDGIVKLVNRRHSVVGGSTLATQIEKFRHSPDGVTVNAREKIRQIASASVRAYRHGPYTGDARKAIVLTYINSIPLAASVRYGEVIGLGDGLWAWYHMDFEDANRTLWEIEHMHPGSPLDPRAGVTVRAALSLFLAQRRPTEYLLYNRQALRRLTETYLHIMARDGVISPALRDAALAQDPPLAWGPKPSPPLDPARRNATNLVRARLLAQTGVPSVYDVDRLDLEVTTTINADLQEKATAVLRGLLRPEEVARAGLIGPHLLDKGDPSQVVYSFSLFERTAEGNLLRVQTSTSEAALNIDEQTKLDLGSSAKLRTLIHYLELITELYHAYRGDPHRALGSLGPRTDPLTRWAYEYLADHPQADLQTLLDAAMERRYSANPSEKVFTGGGLHTFSNFNKADDRRVMSVREAFSNSVNLVFVRLMRDIVHHHVYRRYRTTPLALETLDREEKRRLLEAFADREGVVFLRRFYARYHGKTPQDIQRTLFDEVGTRPRRITAVFRYLSPTAPLDSLEACLFRALPQAKVSAPYVQKLYEDCAPEKLTLADVGHLATVHPLELWVARYLMEHPEGTLREAIEASGSARQQVYRWLFTSRSRRAQLRRIRTIVELEAFQDIHQAWQRLGYPFDYLTPSYATTLGSSGDRPAALAELCGIILNDGIRSPSVRVKTLHFARGTPYETRLDLSVTPGERVLSPEVASTVKRAMSDVGSSGTARRLQRGFELPDGSRLSVGGKTGTGDHRYKTFDAKGRLIHERVVNRTATFVFFMGDRFFGSITAYVSGEAAQDYGFSSSLPVQVLKVMMPELIPHLQCTPNKGASTEEAPRRYPRASSAGSQEDLDAPGQPVVFHHDGDGSA